jgi:hypothetical protein
MKLKIILFTLIAVLLTQIQLFSCTIFYVANNNKVLAGSNEDWKDPFSKMWFYPPEDDKYGWIKFGWGSGFPQGGMNDQGLFWDATASPYLAMPFSEANKEKYPGPLMQKVIRECANIEEALKVFADYYCEDQYNAQYLIGDSTGNSIIVEGDNIISIEGNYQVLTNFYQSHPDLGGYPCRRYETAVEMLGSNYDLSAYFVGSILAATHQEGKYPTQYSNIYDLKSCFIHLFYYHNYEEFITINLSEELIKRYRSFDIPGLFSRVKLVSPVNGDEVEPASVTFSWEGIPENSYEVIYSTDPGFSAYHSTWPKNMPLVSINHSGLFYMLPGLLFLIFGWVKKKDIVLFSIIILFAILFSNQCKKDENPSPEEQVATITTTVNNLLPGATYYWKIISHPNNQDNFYSETLTQSFKTTDILGS